MLLASSDGGLCLMLLLLIGGGIYIVVKVSEARTAAAEVKAQEELKMNHPEVWRQQELLKLEKARLEMQGKLAEEQARQEKTRRNVGIVMTILRILFGR